jgi:3-phosphoglycerate kinase
MTNSKAKNILIRVDFSTHDERGVIGNDSRIRGALPTIKAVARAKCNAIWSRT